MNRRGPTAEEVRRRVASFIGENRLLSKGDGVLVGVSGGPDSMALRHILRELAPGMRLSLRAAHLHHGPRGREADSSEAARAESSSTAT